MPDSHGKTIPNGLNFRLRPAPLRLGEVEGARLVRGDRGLAVRSLACDSRSAVTASLFICLRGERHDGHDFIAEAARRGAVAALCKRGRDRADAPLALLETDDPLRTLGMLGNLVRRRSRARVVGIAGSAGKTSTKDVLRALLAPHLPTVASPASYNNELGLPLTLSLIERETRICICELGTGAPGELARLCRIAEPDLGILTAIGPEHLEFFGSLERVAAEEARLIAALPAGAPVVLPHAAPLLDPHRRVDLEEWTFGCDAGADVYPLGWRTGDGLTQVVLSVRDERAVFRTNLLWGAKNSVHTRGSIAAGWTQADSSRTLPASGEDDARRPDAAGCLILVSPSPRASVTSVPPLRGTNLLEDAGWPAPMDHPVATRADDGEVPPRVELGRTALELRKRRQVVAWMYPAPSSP